MSKQAMRDETERAFDLNRNLIYAIAAKVYGRGRKGRRTIASATA
jgi:hypothetical protein